MRFLFLLFILICYKLGFSQDTIFIKEEPKIIRKQVLVEEEIIEPMADLFLESSFNFGVNWMNPPSKSEALYNLSENFAFQLSPGLDFGMVKVKTGLGYYSFRNHMSIPYKESSSDTNIHYYESRDPVINNGDTTGYMTYYIEEKEIKENTINYTLNTIKPFHYLNWFIGIGLEKSFQSFSISLHNSVFFYYLINSEEKHETDLYTVRFSSSFLRLVSSINASWQINKHYHFSIGPKMGFTLNPIGNTPDGGLENQYLSIYTKITYFF